MRIALAPVEQVEQVIAEPLAPLRSVPMGRLGRLLLTRGRNDREARVSFQRGLLNEVL